MADNTNLLQQIREIVKEENAPIVNRLDNLEAGQVNLKDGQTRLEEGQKKLEIGQNHIDTALEALAEGQKDIRRNVVKELKKPRTTINCS